RPIQRYPAASNTFSQQAQKASPATPLMPSIPEKHGKSDFLRAHHWSSTTDAYYPYGAWIVYFGHGYGYNSYKYYGSHVRAVRGGKRFAERRCQRRPRGESGGCDNGLVGIGGNDTGWYDQPGSGCGR
ncbi:MAG: hypothetical protein AB1547_14830, partial [Thermodesulfobacteriota bacterium]